MPKAAFLAPLLLLACAANQRAVVGVDQVPPGSKCTESAALQAFVGQPASTALGAQLMAASRAHHLRWVPAGGAATADYSVSRLTVQLDAANRVVSAKCT